MEELDLKELFGIFWGKKIQIILIIAIFVVIGVIYTFGFTTPMYSSTTTLVLASAGSDKTTNGGEGGITTTDVTLNSKLVSTYSELIKRNYVLGQVLSNLDVDVTENELRKNVTVKAVSDTELIEITVSAKDAEDAAKITDEIAKVFTEKVKELYNINNVQVIDKAKVATAPSNINHTKDIIIFAFVGLVIAVIYVLVINMLDTTIKTAEEIEKEFKLPVLASIPICGTDLSNTKAKGGRRK